MPSDKEIEIAAKAMEVVWKLQRTEPFGFLPRELRMLARAAIAAVDTERGVRQAATITVGLCDFCPSIHINLLDEAKDVFATASLPCSLGERFIADFRRQLEASGKRPSTTAVRQ